MSDIQIVYPIFLRFPVYLVYFIFSLPELHWFRYVSYIQPRIGFSFARNWSIALLLIQSICINWDAWYVWSQHGHVILLTYIWYYVMLYLLCFFLYIICFLTFIFHGRYLERFLLQLYSFTSYNVLNSLCLYLDFYCLVCWF